MSRHILVISQYFYPEQFRINDICSEWVARGYKVTVITGIPNYPQGKFYKGYGLFRNRREQYNGIDIIRIPLIPRGKRTVTLALNYLSFVVSGFFMHIFTRIKADVVFIFEVSPMTQALPGVWYAQKKRVPCYLYVQDLWPENVEILSGIKNKTFLNAIGKMVDYIYARCNIIFVTSRSFAASISQRGVPKEKIKYWPQYAEDFYKPVSVEEQENKSDRSDVFNVTFTGNIGLSQGIDVLPKAALILKQAGYGAKVNFHIVGDGRYKDQLIEVVREADVADMFDFSPKQPATRIPAILAASDAAFLCLADNPLFKMTIPAKLQSYMACGIAVIAAAEGEACAMIKEAGAGVCSPPNDASALADNVIQLAGLEKQELQLLGHNARKYYEAHFNKDKLLQEMDDYLRNDYIPGGDTYV